MPFRLGTTSYILPDGILPNVQYLANRVDDVELLFFEVCADGSDLPGTAEVRQLKILAAEGNLSYTVHLPLDLRFSSDENLEPSLGKAQRVIEACRQLDPWAYVLHLNESEASLEHGGLARIARALNQLGRSAGSTKLLAVENLPGQPTGTLEAVTAKVPVSRCLDIGHMWAEGVDPLPQLERLLSDTRVIHLHGVEGRDHKALDSVPPEQLERVMRTIIARGYSGVVTLEVFDERDLERSIKALGQALEAI
ncbi:MAG: cobamide remodeling phosphodiesterase CbiR [Anaerolineales bacterium]